MATAFHVADFVSGVQNRMKKEEERQKATGSRADAEEISVVLIRTGRRFSIGKNHK